MEIYYHVPAQTTGLKVESKSPATHFAAVKITILRVNVESVCYPWDSVGDNWSLQGRMGK